MFSVKFKVSDENRNRRGSSGGIVGRRSATPTSGGGTSSLRRNLRSPTPSVLSTNSSNLSSILTNGGAAGSKGKRKSKDDKRRIRIITSSSAPGEHRGGGGGKQYKDALDAFTELKEDRFEIHIERTSAGLGLSIAGGKGSTPFKGDDEGIFISRVTEGGPADLAGLRVGDKVLKVNGISVEEADHYDAVEVLKACGSVLVLYIAREVTRLIGHPVFDESGSVAQINVVEQQHQEALHQQQQQQQLLQQQKVVPAPITVVVEQQRPLMGGIAEGGGGGSGENPHPSFNVVGLPNGNAGTPAPISLLNGNEITHKVILHTTLIRDQIGQGLGFSIAGGKGHAPFRDGSEGIYISKITENGVAHKDGKILVGDRVLAINGVDITNAHHDNAVQLLTDHQRFVRLVVQREVKGSMELPASPRSPMTKVLNPSGYMANRPAYSGYRRSIEDPADLTPTGEPTIQPSKPGPEVVHSTIVHKQSLQQSQQQHHYQQEQQQQSSFAQSSSSSHPSQQQQQHQHYAKATELQQSQQPQQQQAPLPAPRKVLSQTSVNNGNQISNGSSSNNINNSNNNNTNGSSSTPHQQSSPSSPSSATTTSTSTTEADTIINGTSNNSSIVAKAPNSGEDAQEVVLPKDQGSLGFSIIGGTDHSCTPFGAHEPGIFISHIVPGGIAALSGKLRMGDRILKVNGTDVTSATHQEAVMELLRPCDEIKLTVQHDPLPAGFQEVRIVKQEGERLGMHIKGGLNGQRGNPLDPADEGVFISKINSSGAAKRDSRLRVGMRILEVNGASLLGATHQEAVNSLRASGNELHLVVCKGYEKSDLVHQSIGSAGGMSAGLSNNGHSTRIGSRASETGSELSQSVSSLDRDDSIIAAEPSRKISVDRVPEEDDAVYAQVTEPATAAGQHRPPPSSAVAAVAVPQSVQNRFTPNVEQSQALISTREKSTPEKVLDIVRAAESLALGGSNLVENGPPKSPTEPPVADTLQKTTTIVMSKHTLDTHAPQSPPPAQKTPKSVSDKKRFFENAMEDQTKQTPKPEKVFSFLSQDEVEKLKQEEEKKIATLGRRRIQERAYEPEDEEEYCSGDEEGHERYGKPDENDNDMSINSSQPPTTTSTNLGLVHHHPTIHEEEPTTPTSAAQLRTPVSRIPIRTANAEKRARANDMLPPEYDESKLSPSEIRALRAQKRAAWRQARLKSLENDALQAQIMIQTMNAVTMHEENGQQQQQSGPNNPIVLHLKSDYDSYPTTAEHEAIGNNNCDEQEQQVETMREKIIMLELEEPSSGSSERQVHQLRDERDKFEDHDDSTEAADVSLEEDEYDCSQLDQLDSIDEREEQQHQQPRHVRSTLQTIVEVVNPKVVEGSAGQVNDIIIGRYNDDCGEDSFASASSPSAYGSMFAYEEGRYESINDKMKNVLRELKQNKKVRLNLSKSLTEEELAEQEEEAVEEEEDEDEEFRRQEQMMQDEDEEFRHYEEKTGAIGTVFMVRERLINDFYTHQSELAQQEDDHQQQQGEDEDYYDGCEVIQNPNAQAFEDELEKMHSLSKLKAVFCDDDGDDDEYEEVVVATGSSTGEAGTTVRKNSGGSVEKASGIPVATSNAGSKRKKRKGKKKK